MSFATPPEPARGQLADRLFVACGLAWGAAVLYSVAALHHVDDHAPAAIVALVLSAALLAWTAALYRSPTSRAVRIAGALLAAAVLGLWIADDPTRAATGALGPFSQTVLLCRLLPGGVPVTAEQWTPAALTTLVSIANIDVLALVAIVAASRRAGRMVAWLGAALVLLSCVSLGVATGGHAH